MANFSEFMQDPNKLALLNAGVNMLAAAQGGRRDLSQQGLGYGLQQGLLGAAQGYQMGNQFRDKAREDATKERFMGLLGSDAPQGGILGDQMSPAPQMSLAPQQDAFGTRNPMQSPAVQPPQAQQDNMFSVLTPQEKAMAQMLVQSGDMKGVYTMLENKQKALAASRADFTDIGGMRKELEPLAAEAREMKGNFDALYNTLTKDNPNAVDDVAVVFQFMKSLDPGSVVREGEQIMLKRTDGIFGVLGNYLQGIKSGKSFNPQQRRNILESAYGNFKSRIQPIYEAGMWRGNIAEGSGVKRSDVVSPMFDKIPTWLTQYGPKTWPAIPVNNNGATPKPITSLNPDQYETF